MTKDSELSSRERHLVVVFDICSSTTILEDLKRTDNLSAWRNLLICLKDYLLQRGAPLQMDLYKFIGDGWVILFPSSMPKLELCAFLAGLSQSFESQFEAFVKPLLSAEPSPIGLMFGVDAGELTRMVLDNKVEYMGRAINVASRLQVQTKELQGGPAYKAIFSKNSYNWPAPPPKGLATETIQVSLRNISPPTIQCFAWDTFDPMLGKFVGAAAARPAEIAKQPVVEDVAPAPKAAGPQLKAVDARAVQMASLGALGKWTSHRSGQPGVVAQFIHGAPGGAAPPASIVASAQLIYRSGEKELLRVRGAWLDGFDLAKFNAHDTRSLIVGVNGENGFFALAAVRTTVSGAERIEIRPSRFAPVPPKLTVAVQLMDADGREVLYQGEFAITTNPLTIARLP